jgi:phosphatidylinositol alpha-1,6-mannosyltransferase
MPILLTFDYPPARGGIQKYAERLANELAALNFRTVVIAPTSPGSATYDAAERSSIRRFSAGRGPLRVLAAALYFLRWHRAAGDGHTIALSWLPAAAAAIFPRRLRGELTIVVHGTELDVAPGSARDRLMRFVFSRADHVVANSHFVAERARRLGLAQTIDIAWPGVDQRECERFPAATPTIVFVGRLIARKGIDRLIAAISLLGRRDIELHVIGDGPQRAALEALAAELKVADQVRFCGQVDDRARDRALAQAWCFAMPARNEGGDVEGFGIVYLEAAMAGLPSIGGRGNGADDAIVDGETGFLVDGGDARAIADAVALLIDDPQRAAAMGRAARERAQRTFSWRATAQSVLRSMALERGV